MVVPHCLRCLFLFCLLLLRASVVVRGTEIDGQNWGNRDNRQGEGESRVQGSESNGRNWGNRDNRQGEGESRVQGSESNGRDRDNRGRQIEKDDDLLRQTIAETKMSVIEEAWNFLDLDCNGVITEEDAAFAMAGILGKDPMYVLSSWTALSCKAASPPEDSSLMQILLKLIFLTIGRVDVRPCSIASILAFAPERSEAPEEQQAHAPTLQKSAFVPLMLLFLEVLPSSSKKDFQRMDTDSDGCLSEAEWHKYLNASAMPTFLSEFIDLSPSLTDISTYQKNLDGFQLFDSPSCIGARHFWRWTQVSFFYDAMPFLNVANSLQRAKSCTEQGDQKLDKPEQGTDSTLAIAASISGGCSIICISLCAVAWKYRSQRERLDGALQVNNLLKAKIDAWSTFDARLTVKVSKLEPAFVHCLGLNNYEADTLSLFDIVHDDDAVTLESLLQQAQRERRNKTLPVMATVQFQYACTSAPVKVSVEPAYIRVELLMSWVSETSILVGLTSQGEVSRSGGNVSLNADLRNTYGAARFSDRDELSQAASSVSQGEVLLNGSDVTSVSEFDAKTFRSMEVNGRHGGGLVTKAFNDVKVAETQQSLKELFGHMGAKPSEQGPDVSAETRDSASSPAESSKLSPSDHSRLSQHRLRL